jgi:hypothetical protein
MNTIKTKRYTKKTKTNSNVSKKIILKDNIIIESNIKMPLYDNKKTETETETYKIKQTLSPEQIEIITNTDFTFSKQAICVVACAGSGKTTTIINKVKYMIQNMGLNPTEFVLTTFTKNAANELKKKMIAELSHEVVEQMQIGTLHSIALTEILKTNQEIYKNKPESIPEEYLIKYFELLNDVDYEQSYNYIFIDEYQDINELQYKIIKKWYEKCKLLVVVGDDQQNIYTFRKTSIKYILNFCEDLNGSYKYLNENYRCNSSIVHMTNLIIEQNMDRIKKNIKAGNLNPELKPKIRFFENETKELEYIIKKINKIRLSSNQTIAILSRTNKKLYKAENHLLLNNFSINVLNIEFNQLTNNHEFNPNDIILSTIHGSKGLEFDYVFIINCMDNSFPTSGADLQEERRLFYVACTRAKHELFITSVWNESNNFRPSRFIYELYSAKSNYIDIPQINWTTPTYEQNNINRMQNLSDLIYNIDIDILSELKELNILPSEKCQAMLIETVHDDIKPDEIISYNIKSDLEILYEQTYNILIKRSISEITDETFIHIEYLANNQIIFNHKNSLKKAIKLFIDHDESDQIDQHLTYFKKSNIYFPTNKNLLKQLLCVISNKNYSYIDLTSNIFNKSTFVFLKNSYDKYCNHNLKTLDIIDDIINLAILSQILKGRFSLQYLINHIEFIDKIKMIEHFDQIYNNINDLIKKSHMVNYNINIDKNYIEQTSLIIDDRIIIIESKCTQKPSIKDFVRYLIYFAKYNLLIGNDSNDLHIIEYYNPINGKIYKWDLSELDNKWSNQIINFFTRFL